MFVRFSQVITDGTVNEFFIPCDRQQPARKVRLKDLL
jgi:hypothetical protein